MACELWRDPRGILHLRAASGDEVIACLGYAHGRDRAWQMDYLRRVAQGRVSEIKGRKSLQSDFVLRILGLPEHAERIVGEMTPATRAFFERYARGVNRGLEDALKAGVYEFRDFGYVPDPWQARDSVMLTLLQAFDQTRKTFDQRLVQSERIQRFGAGAEDLFKEDGLPWDTSILKEGEYRKPPRETVARATPADGARSAGLSLAAAGTLRELLAGMEDVGLGSNNWVIAPERSSSGKAWMANDPHLALNYPPFWSWAHVEAQASGIDVIGAALPGVPVIVSGANRDMAWGLTNSYIDVADAYFVPKAELKGLPSIRPWIWVKFWKFRLPFFFKSFQRTAEGWPVFPKGPEGKELVVRWSGFQVRAADFESMARLMSSRTVAEMDSALAGVGIPSWNFVFADTRGGIGFRTVGRAPLLSSVPARPPYGVVELGSPEELPKWKFRTSEQMPSVLNPRRGYVVTANNRQWPKESWDFGGSAYSRGFRAFRIEELLLREPKHDFESQRRIQCDTQAVEARFLLKPLLEIVHELAKERAGQEAPAARRARELLSKWQAQGKFDTGLDCAECPFYRLWQLRLIERLGIGEGALFRALGKPDYPGLREAAWDALAEAAQELERLGPAKTWGDLHRAPFAHLAGADYRAESPIPSPGDENSVNPGNSTWTGAIFKHTSGASQRLLVELASPPVIRLALAGSQADLEVPERGRTDGPWMKWARCEYERVPFPLEWDRIPAAERSRIEL